MPGTSCEHKILQGHSRTNNHFCLEESGKHFQRSMCNRASAQGSIGHLVKAQLLDEMRVMSWRMSRAPMGFWFLCTRVNLSLLIYAAVYQKPDHSSTFSNSLRVWGGFSLFSKTVHPVFLKNTVSLIFIGSYLLCCESQFTSLLNECISLSPS